MTLFVDWMGKADMDKELRLLKLRCFSALEDKLVRSLENDCEFGNQEWAQLLLVFGKYEAFIKKFINKQLNGIKDTSFNKVFCYFLYFRNIEN